MVMVLLTNLPRGLLVSNQILSFGFSLRCLAWVHATWLGLLAIQSLPAIIMGRASENGYVHPIISHAMLIWAPSMSLFGWLHQAEVEKG